MHIPTHYKLRSDLVHLVGDTHSVRVTQAVLKEIEPDTDIVHLGDVGLGFGATSYGHGGCFYDSHADRVVRAKQNLDDLQKIAQEKNQMVYLIRGNHDAPWVWYDLYENQLVYLKDDSSTTHWPNVICLKDGDVLHFPNGKKAITFGGGISVDRWGRVPNVSYWPDETTKVPDGLDTTCDFMFSHDCPAEFNNQTASLSEHFSSYIKLDKALLHDCDIQRNRMTELVKFTRVKAIFHGHFHNSKREALMLGDQMVYDRCLNIDEILKFDSNCEAPYYEY